ncbi:MAG: hypothetical protein LM558_00190 [Thermosphaera sp.]|jgi:hypothetical protein|nr:hypothetical protein [Thermosphaera sp.]
MPEDFKTYVNRLYEHARKHIELLANALNNEEYDTADFLAHVIVMDLTKMREVINNQLRFSKKQ